MFENGLLHLKDQVIGLKTFNAVLTFWIFWSCWCLYKISGTYRLFFFVVYICGAVAMFWPFLQFTLNTTVSWTQNVTIRVMDMNQKVAIRELHSYFSGLLSQELNSSIFQSLSNSISPSLEKRMPWQLLQAVNRFDSSYMQSTALITETSCQQLQLLKQAVDSSWHIWQLLQSFDI